MCDITRMCDVTRMIMWHMCPEFKLLLNFLNSNLNFQLKVIIPNFNSKNFRCTVIFKFFWGGTWCCLGGGPLFLCFIILLPFYVTIFQSLLRGYMRCPSTPPPCASAIFKISKTFATPTPDIFKFHLLYFLITVLFVYFQK
jgi:hypothetical protein